MYNLVVHPGFPWWCWCCLLVKWCCLVNNEERGWNSTCPLRGACCNGQQNYCRQSHAGCAISTCPGSWRITRRDCSCVPVFRSHRAYPLNNRQVGTTDFPSANLARPRRHGTGWAVWLHWQDPEEWSVSLWGTRISGWWFGTLIDINSNPNWQLTKSHIYFSEG